MTISGDIFLEPWVSGVDEGFGRAFEDDFSLVENKEFGAVVYTVVWNKLHFSCLRIEPVSGEREGVL